MKTGYVTSFLLAIFNAGATAIAISESFPTWMVAMVAFVSGLCLSGAFYQWVMAKERV